MKEKEVVTYLLNILSEHRKSQNSLTYKNGKDINIAYFLGRLDEISFIENVLHDLLKEQELQVE